MEPIPLAGMPVSENELASELCVVRSFLVHYFVKRGTQFDVAEEAAAEGVLKACLKAHFWNGSAKLRTYLICVGQRAAIDYLRKEKTQARVKRRALEDSETDSR